MLKKLASKLRMNMLLLGIEQAETRLAKRMHRMFGVVQLRFVTEVIVVVVKAVVKVVRYPYCFVYNECRSFII